MSDPRLIEVIKQSRVDIHGLRLALFVIFAIFGTFKWFDFEVEALKPLFEQTWLIVLPRLFGPAGASYVLGVVETITFICLAVGVFMPRAGVVGAVLTIVTGLVTLSLLPQLDKLDSFIFKDVLLIGGGLVLLKHDLLRVFEAHPSTCRPAVM